MTKTKSTKRALLMSALALLMCVSMLIGSTFAWFTDSVTSGNNKIVAGTLDVQLLMNTGNGYVDISDNNAPIFGEGSIAQNNNAETLWEPGKTQVAYLAIKNNGNLALKYTVGLDVQNVSKDLYKVMEYAITPDAQYNSVTTWVDNGNSVVVGTQSVSESVSLGVGETHYFALSIHMDEAAGNEYQGGEVNFDLTVLATQDTVESDSFNNQYDAGAYFDGQIGTPEELVAALSNKEIKEDTTFVLGADIDMTGVQLAPARIYYGASVSFVGNGYTISNVELVAPSPMQNGMENIGMFCLDESASLTVSDLTVENAIINGNSTGYSDAAVIVGYANSKTNVVLNNVDVINGNVKNTAGNAALFVGYAANSTVTITDSIADGTAEGERTDKTGAFFGTINSGCNITLTNCVNATEMNDYGRKLGDEVVNGEAVSATAIATADELQALSNKSATGTFILIDDIDLNGASIASIGAAYGKELTVVGNGHKISNATLAAGTHNGMNNYGLFYAYTNSTLTISDLVIENVNVEATASNYGAAVVIGYMDGGSNVTLDNVDVANCSVKNSYDEAAVYVGYQTGTLSMVDCDSTGCTVEGASAIKTGAFIGHVNGNGANLENCTTDLTINATNRDNGTLVIK